MSDVTDFRMLLDEINEKNVVLQQQNKELLKVEEELSDANKRLEQIAIKDELTDCYNKRYLLQQLNHEIATAQRYKRLFSIMLLDLDNFKLINDKYGQLVGDDVLRIVVNVLKRNLRQSDILARFGGEEFIIYLPQTDKKGAIFFAERIRGAVQNHSIKISGRELNITVSVGLVSVRPDDQQIENPVIFMEDLLEQTDRALYKAKSNGRNCVVYADVHDNLNDV